MMTTIEINRFTGAEDVSMHVWQGLIAHLVLAGYEVSADEERITFKLGHDDKVTTLD